METAAAAPITFGYTRAIQTFTVPSTGPCDFLVLLGTARRRRANAETL